MIPGRECRDTEALCWVGERLFSAGLNGEITEYDLAELKPSYTVAAFGGAIWTMSSSSQGRLLAVSPSCNCLSSFRSPVSVANWVMSVPGWL